MPVRVNLKDAAFSKFQISPLRRIDLGAPVSMRGFGATAASQQAMQEASELEEAEALDSLDEKTSFMVKIGARSLAR